MISRDRLAKFLKLRKSGSYNMAWGHAFKTGKQIPSFKNVDVFNLVNCILGLKYSGKVDGTDQLADEILIKNRRSP